MTVANLFAKHRAGYISKEKFLYEVRKDAQLPYISNLTSYDDAIKMLKQKSVIKEALQDESFLGFGKKKEPFYQQNDGPNIHDLADDIVDILRNKYSKTISHDKAVDLVNKYAGETESLKTYSNKYRKPSDYAIAADIIKTARGNRESLEEAQEADTDSDYLEFSDGETVVSMHKDGGKWIEGDVIEGEKPYGWGGKTYMSYLSSKEIARYLRQDYGGDWQVSDENTDYSDEPLDEQVNTQDKFDVVLVNGEKYHNVTFKSIDSFETEDGKSMMHQQIKSSKKAGGLSESENSEGNLTSYDDAIKMLKQKSVIKEALQDEAFLGFGKKKDQTMHDYSHPNLKDTNIYSLAQAVQSEYQKEYKTRPSIDQAFAAIKKYAGDIEGRKKNASEYAIANQIIRKAGKTLAEAKNTPKSILKEQADLFLTIDRMNPILVNKAVNVELAKLPEINAAVYQKTLEKVVKKLQKDPRCYDDVFVSNAKEINKEDQKRKMVPVKKELKDPHHQMKSPKGIEKHKANTKTSTKENKKGKPKGVKEMSSIAKGHKGVKQMKQPEKKHRVMEAIETFLKKKLTEDSHHVYGIGMGVETPDGPGTVKAIVGSTLTVELGEGKHKDYQMNIINHYSGHHDSVPNELDNAKIKKFDAKAKPGVKTVDEKKDDVIKKVMEFLKKKKKKEVDEVATAKTTDAAHNQSVLNKLNKVQGPARAEMQKAFNSGQAIDI
jgi:hypothetical protein